MSITTNWILPLGLAILSSLIVLVKNAPKPIRIKGNRRRK
ncbi:hypothetical protein MNBD_NITROSPINAE05-1136 [hydrothermal vent metagenome]|uniref:Uncharacterized protein n=1 Tax=hydrothermal vent metagenome TaxID=652676 RepID=A0A3B1D747_9ZZZZ